MKNIALLVFIISITFSSYGQSNAKDFATSSGVKFASKDYIGAIEDINEAIKLEPNNIKFYYTRALLMEKIEDYKGAILNYSKIIEIDSSYDDYHYYFKRARMKDALKDYRGAIEDLNKCINNAKNVSSTHYFNRAESKASLKDYNGALLDFNKVIDIDPKDSEAYHRRGGIKMMLNDKDGACLDWSKAGELGDFSVYDLIQKYCN